MSAPTMLQAVIEGAVFSDPLDEGETYVAVFASPVRIVNIVRQAASMASIPIKYNADTVGTGDMWTKPTVASNHWNSKTFFPVDKVSFDAAADEVWGDTINIVGVQ